MRPRTLRLPWTLTIPQRPPPPGLFIQASHTQQLLLPITPRRRMHSRCTPLRPSTQPRRPMDMHPILLPHNTLHSHRCQATGIPRSLLPQFPRPTLRIMLLSCMGQTTKQPRGMPLLARPGCQPPCLMPLRLRPGRILRPPLAHRSTTQKRTRTATHRLRGMLLPSPIRRIPISAAVRISQQPQIQPSLRLMF